MTTQDLKKIREEESSEAGSSSAKYEGELLGYKTEDAKAKTKLNQWVSRFIPRAVNVWLLILLIFLVLDSFTLHLPALSCPIGEPPWYCLLFQLFSFDVDTYVMAAFVGSTSLAVGGLVNFALKGLLGKD